MPFREFIAGNTVLRKLCSCFAVHQNDDVEIELTTQQEARLEQQERMGTAQQQAAEEPTVQQQGRNDIQDAGQQEAMNVARNGSEEETVGVASTTGVQAEDVADAPAEMTQAATENVPSSEQQKTTGDVQRTSEEEGMQQSTKRDQEMYDEEDEDLDDAPVSEYSEEEKIRMKEVEEENEQELARNREWEDRQWDAVPFPAKISEEVKAEWGSRFTAVDDPSFQYGMSLEARPINQG